MMDLKYLITQALSKFAKETKKDFTEEELLKLSADYLEDIERNPDLTIDSNIEIYDTPLFRKEIYEGTIELNNGKMYSFELIFEKKDSDTKETVNIEFITPLEDNVNTTHLKEKIIDLANRTIPF